MNETAGIALLYLMFGQFLIMSFGILILWWMSEPGAAWTQSKAQRRTQAEAPLPAPEASVQPSADPATDIDERPAAKRPPSTGDALLALARDRSIEPKPANDRFKDERVPASSQDHVLRT
jgi:hypothetical protein